MRALVPKLPSRASTALRRAAVVLCLLLALTSWLDGQAQRAPASRSPARPAAGEAATSVPVFAQAAHLVRAGDRVDLVAPEPPGTSAGGASGDGVVARNARVLSVHSAAGGFGNTGDAAEIVVATSRPDAVAIASAMARAPFAVIVTAP